MTDDRLLGFAGLQLHFFYWYYSQYPLGWLTEIRALKSRKTMHPPLQDVLVKSGCVFIGQYLSGAPQADARDK